MITAMRGLLLSGFVVGLSACSNGGNVTYETGARSKVIRGSPFAQVNEGGRALVVENGKTATTGVHGWVAVQSVASQHSKAGSGHSLVINKTAAYR